MWQTVISVNNGQVECHLEANLAWFSQKCLNIVIIVVLALLALLARVVPIRWALFPYFNIFYRYSKIHNVSDMSDPYVYSLGYIIKYEIQCPNMEN